MKTILTIMVLALVPALSRAEGDENERGKLIEALRRSAPEPRAAWGYVFNLDQRPELVWRDPELLDPGVRPVVEDVAWFDSTGRRSEAPDHGGRWIAVVRSRHPDGRAILRGRTLFARPEGFFLLPLAGLGLELRELPATEEGGPAGYAGEAKRIVERVLLEELNGQDQRGALLAAGWHDAQQDDAAERLRYGIEDRGRQCELRARIAYEKRETGPLPPPRRFAGAAAPVLRAVASSASADELDRICQDWADASGSPFSSLVARDGEILHHRAFAPQGGGEVDLGFRADVASITKVFSGMLAARFLDAGMIELDAPVSSVFPGFAAFPEHTPTFRQCLRHQSGLAGHGSWGGVGNVWFDQVVFDGIETLQPGPRRYAGDGFDLVGAAMQVLTGETVTRLFHRGYFEPLDLPPLAFGQMGSGMRPTVFGLSVLGQVLANEGRYGELEFFSRETFQQLLPTAYADLPEPDPDNKDHYYGLGIRWVREHRNASGAPLFSPRTLGHGSLSHSVFIVDLERKLVIAQVRGKGTEADAEWFPRFLEAVDRLTAL